MSAHASWLLLVLGLAGCPSGGGGTSDDGGTAAIPIQVGTGTTNFQEIPTAGSLSIIKGPQGGIHFIVNARTAEMDQPGNKEDPGDSANPITRFEAFTSDGAVMHWDLPPYHLGYFPAEAGPPGWEIGGHILRLVIPMGDTPDSYIAKILGKQIRIRVTVEQVNGRTGSDEITITVAPDMP